MVKVVPEINFENEIRHTIITILFSERKRERDRDRERERERDLLSHRIGFIKLTYINFEPLGFIEKKLRHYPRPPF